MATRTPHVDLALLALHFHRFLIVDEALLRLLVLVVDLAVILGQLLAYLTQLLQILLDVLTDHRLFIVRLIGEASLTDDRTEFRMLCDRQLSAQQIELIAQFDHCAGRRPSISKAT